MMLSTSEKYGENTNGPSTVVNNNFSCGCECGNGSGGGTTDHEQLNNLFGGDASGHYHLTQDEYEAVIKLIEAEPEEEWTEFDGGFCFTSEEEYNANKDHWLDGGFSSDDHDDIEIDGGESVW